MEEEAKAHTSCVEADSSLWESPGISFPGYVLQPQAHTFPLAHSRREGEAGRKPPAETGSVYLTY